MNNNDCYEEKEMKSRLVVRKTQEKLNSKKNSVKYIYFNTNNNNNNNNSNNNTNSDNNNNNNNNNN
jgi:hypothetical protein